jgi:transcriptional regulator with PAS, ATPase and Fis domain
VLLTGESGTGKELAAHAIHKLSPRRDDTMVMVNAAALPATLVESELFGYEAGSFTGAERKGRKGKIEQADRGSLFFDEVGDMPAEVQVKLLRVLQDGTFQRVGGNDLRRSNFRLISASNRNFEAMIAEGSFRLDLFYRIGGVTIRLPALRERSGGHPAAGRSGAEAVRRAAMAAREEALRSRRLVPAGQRWPGNVRQLMHTVERAAIFSDSDVIEPSDFGTIDLEPGETLPSAQRRAHRQRADPPRAGPQEHTLVSSAVEQVEEQMIRQAMTKFNGNKKRVAWSWASLALTCTSASRRWASAPTKPRPDRCCGLPRQRSGIRFPERRRHAVGVVPQGRRDRQRQ